MSVETEYPLTLLAIRLLHSYGISLDSEKYLRGIGEFRSLCSTWNLAAKLMSARDLRDHFDAHIADSLSLLPYLPAALEADGAHVDIGSGGGFPAIPLALAFGAADLLLIERSERKSAFLRQATARLGLERATVLTVNFPALLLPEKRRIFTARAVERPNVVDPQILKCLRPGDTYLAQRDIRGLSGLRPEGVRELNDTFTGAGLRRGNAYEYRA